MPLALLRGFDDDIAAIQANGRAIGILAQRKFGTLTHFHERAVLQSHDGVSVLRRADSFAAGNTRADAKGNVLRIRHSENRSVRGLNSGVRARSNATINIERDQSDSDDERCGHRPFPDGRLRGCLRDRLNSSRHAHYRLIAAASRSLQSLATRCILVCDLQAEGCARQTVLSSNRQESTPESPRSRESHPQHSSRATQSRSPVRDVPRRGRLRSPLRLSQFLRCEFRQQHGRG